MAPETYAVRDSIVHQLHRFRYLYDGRTAGRENLESAFLAWTIVHYFEFHCEKFFTGRRGAGPLLLYPGISRTICAF